MKKILLSIILLSSFVVQSQNIVYFERISAISDFSIGQGNVQVHSIGVHPLMEIFISYDQNVSGSPVPSGWIPLSNVLLSDVFGTELNAVGVMPSGDTLIRTHQIITDITEYEITGINSLGLTAEGQWNNQTWQIQTSFTGPDLNCDAYNIDDFFGVGGVTCVNNQLTLDDGASFFLFFGGGKVLYNLDNSFFTYLVMDLSGATNPTDLTGVYLNAFIPRVLIHPSSETACDGIVNFERVSMVNDVVLEYAINGSSFSPLSVDQLTNVCANDTIAIIGFSPSITSYDTLVEMQYVLKSVANIYAIEFDISNMTILLNANTTGSNCSNDITLENNNTVGLYTGVGYVFDEDNNDMELYLWPISPIAIPYQCQQKYKFYSFGFNESSLTNFFSYTILDQNNIPHGDLFDLEVSNSHSAIGSCFSDIKISNTGQSVPSSSGIIRWDNIAGSFQGVAVGNSIMGPPPLIEYNNMCSNLYSFDYNSEHQELFIVTDSLQKIILSENAGEITIDDNGDGMVEQIFTMNYIDTIIHYWDECTNDYSLPFSTVSYDDNILIDPIDFLNTVEFINYECNFSLTQNATNIILPYRDVLAPKYYEIQNIIPYVPYYIVAELYCESLHKTTVKRRRIILGPDGSIQDIYGDAYLNTQSLDEINIEVYPNPANDVLNVQSESLISSISIFDINGRVILTKKVNNTLDSIDISKFKGGAYILSIEANGFVTRKRFEKL